MPPSAVYATDLSHFCHTTQRPCATGGWILTERELITLHEHEDLIVPLPVETTAEPYLYTLLCSLPGRFNCYPCHWSLWPALICCHPPPPLSASKSTLHLASLTVPNRCFTETFLQLQRSVNSSCSRLKGRGQWRKMLCKDIHLCSALNLMFLWYSGGNVHERESDRNGEFKELKQSSPRAW